MSTATGFVVSKRGHVVTNQHAIDGCAQVRTRFPTQQSTTAALVALDKGNDLALLEIPFVDGADAAVFRDRHSIRQGDWVMVVGFPLHGLLSSSVSVTTGTISALAGLGDDTRLLQVTAPVQQGNSGGPLIDQSGHIVGIIVAKLSAHWTFKHTGDLPQNVNFAINSTMARAFLDAHLVDYEMAAPMDTGTRQPADIAERAKRYTLLVECLK